MYLSICLSVSLVFLNQHCRNKLFLDSRTSIFPEFLYFWNFHNYGSMKIPEIWKFQKSHVFCGCQSISLTLPFSVYISVSTYLCTVLYTDTCMRLHVCIMFKNMLESIYVCVYHLRRWFRGLLSIHLCAYILIFGGSGVGGLLTLHKHQL